MEQQETDLTPHLGCDESKCVSTARNDLFNHSFTCYGDNVSPMMCADGFLPVVVDDVQFRHLGIGEDESANYFTCCPPQRAFSESSAGHKPPPRQCSDPITIDEANNNDESIEFLCINHGTRKYPRRMKSNWDDDGVEVNSFVCCDSNESPGVGHNNNNNSRDANSTVTNAINFLGEAECVPYQNDYYKPAQIKNEIGLLRPMVCDFFDNDFAFPRSIDGEAWNASGYHRYQCCRNGPALPPFVPDMAFRVTLYPVIAIYCIAAIVSMVVAVGLLIPLLTQLKNGTHRRSSISESRRISRRSSQETRYSTYNLYLVYLALLDLAFCIYQIGMLSDAAGQSFHPRFFGWFVETPNSTHFLSPDFLTAACYAYANMFINAILCHEVLALLKASKFAKRINDPSLTRVNLQVGVVVLAALVIGIGLHYTNEYSPDNVETPFVAVMAVITAVPFCYVVYITVSIWWRGYLPSWYGATANERRLRQLTLFFCRIVGVFLLIWIPCSVIRILIQYNISIGTYDVLVVFGLIGIQPILTFCVILTKEDAKKYIVNLVTFSYRRKKKTKSSNKNITRDRSGGTSMAAIASGEEQQEEGSVADEVYSVGEENAEDEESQEYQLGQGMDAEYPEEEILFDIESDGEDTEEEEDPNRIGRTTRRSWRFTRHGLHHDGTPRTAFPNSEVAARIRRRGHRRRRRSEPNRKNYTKLESYPTQPTPRRYSAYDITENVFELGEDDSVDLTSQFLRPRSNATRP